MSFREMFFDFYHFVPSREVERMYKTFLDQTCILCDGDAYFNRLASSIDRQVHVWYRLCLGCKNLKDDFSRRRLEKIILKQMDDIYNG
jgi:hypothetical protein